MTTSGKIQALTLSLDAQPEEYYGPYSYDATGFKILVHDQNESYPNIEDFGVDLPPGFTTNIRVRRTKVGLKRSLFETSFSETWSQLFNRWIALWITQLVFVILIHWIAIYPVDSAIKRLNSRGQAVNRPFSRGKVLPYMGSIGMSSKIRYDF